MEFDPSRLFKWSSRTYSLRNFIDDNRNTLPRVVQVVEGFCPGLEEETLENGQILILHEIHQERFVVVTQSSGTELCVPLTYPFKVHLVPVDRLNEVYCTVEEVFVAQPDYFLVLDYIPSLDIKSGSVMRICSRQNGVYHLECEVVGQSSCEEIVKLPLDQQGQFQPLHDCREYSLEEAREKGSTLSEIGVWFIDRPGNRVSAETVPLGKSFRLQREFQQHTVVATNVLEEVDGEVLLFPANVDVTIVPILAVSEGMNGKEILHRQQSKISSCLKQLATLSARHAYPVNSPIRTVNLKPCISPPPSPSPHITALLSRQAKSHSHTGSLCPRFEDWSKVTVEGGHHSSDIEVTPEKKGFPLRPAKLHSSQSSDIERVITEKTEPPPPPAKTRSGVTHKKVGLPSRPAKSHCHQTIEVSPELPRQAEPSLCVSRTTEFPNLSANKMTKDNDNVGIIRADDCVEEKSPRFEDRSQIEGERTDKKSAAQEKDDTDSELVHSPSLAYILLRKEDKQAQVNSNESHPEEHIRELPHTSTRRSSHFIPVGRPIPKLRNLKKSPIAPTLPIKISNPNNTLDEKSACRADAAVRTFRYALAKDEVNPQILHELPPNLGYVNVASQSKVTEVIYHMSAGNTAPIFTMQRTRHNYHKEIVALKPRRDNGEGSRYQAEQGSAFEDLPIYINENSFVLDAVVPHPAGFQAMKSDSSPISMQYINESALSFASFHKSHSLSDDRIALSGNVDRRGALASSLSHSSAPDYDNNPHRQPNTEMVARVEASKASMDDYPYINYKPDSHLCDGERETRQADAWSELTSSGDYKDLNDPRAVRPSSSLQLPHRDANCRRFPDTENAKTVEPSESREVESCATNCRVSESSEGEEDSDLKGELAHEDGYLAMDQGEPRERSDSYSYPYAHFLFPRLQSTGRPATSQLRFLLGNSSRKAQGEEGIPELPQKPTFLRPLEETWKIPQLDSASVAPSLPPKRVVSSSSTKKEPYSAAGQENDEGAYLVVDLINDHTLAEQHDYVEINDSGLQGEVVFPLEVPATCAISQNEATLRAPALPPRRPWKSTGKDISTITYDGAYSIIPENQDHEKYDMNKTQATHPLPQRNKFSPIGLFTGKAKKKAKQKKKTDEKSGTERRTIQAQIEDLRTFSTHQVRDRRDDFEDLDTVRMFLEMRARQQELESAISRQKAQYEVEIARQKALSSSSEQVAGIDGTINQDPGLSENLTTTCTNNKLPHGASSEGREREPWCALESPSSPTESTGSSPESHKGDSNGTRCSTKWSKPLVRKPLKRN